MLPGAQLRIYPLPTGVGRGFFCGRWDGFPRRQCIVPPLIISEEELDVALDVMLSVMKEVKPV